MKRNTYLGFVHDLFLYVTPDPHVLEHADIPPHSLHPPTTEVKVAGSNLCLVRVAHVELLHIEPFAQ